MIKILLKRFTFIVLFFIAFQALGQGNGGATCASAVPFCTAELNQPFDNCFNGSPDPNCTSSGEAGPDYTCLNSTPFPTWYFLQIDQAGDLNFTIFQNTNIADDGTLLGTPLDVDFTIWGPFTDANVCGQLTAGNTVDCSFSTAAVENADIPNAQVGEVYVFLITNFDQGQGEIFIQQNNATDPDAGTTDCSIIDATLGPNVDACEGDTITLDATDPQAVDYDWELDTGGGFNPIPGTDGMPTIDVTVSGTYMVTITDAMGDTDSDDLVVTFFEVPIANVPENGIGCNNPTNNGTAIFDLDSTIPEILGGQDPANFNISFHLTEDAAMMGVDALTGTDAYSSGDDEIFVRIENNGNPDCFATTVFNIIVIFEPIANPVPDLLGCDPDGDGIAEFDTGAVESILLGGQTGLDIAYFSSTGNPLPDPLPNPFFNIVPNADTITAILTNPTTGCTDNTTINLIVVTPQVTIPADLVGCDNDLDGLASFNLQALVPDILNGQDPTFFFVSFHTSDADAMADMNAIADPNLFISAGQTIWIRVDDALNEGESTCSVSEQFDLIVALPPIVPNSPILEACDTDNDGFTEFVLGDQNAFFTGGDAMLTVNYYLTDAEANAEITPTGTELDQTLFINNEAFTQTIYVRVENAEGCFAVVEFMLAVLETPMVNDAPELLLVCDEDEDGFGSFDLTLREDEILDGLDPALFTFEWFVTLADAQAGFPVIGDPTAFVTMSTTVYAVVTEEGQSPITRCPSEPVPLELVVEPLPVVPGLMSRIEVCDDIASGSDTDGLSIFDLNSLNTTITGGDTTLNVSYHVDQASADAGTPELPMPYTIGSDADPGPDETIFVRVADELTGCFMTATLTLAVIPLPSPIAVSPIEECDNDGDGMAIFDLTDPDLIQAIVNGEPITITFHLSEQAAIDGVDAIADADLAMFEATDNTTLYIRAVNDQVNDFTLEQCSSVIAITLTVLPPPEVPLTLPDLGECDDDEDGMVTFADITLNESLILGTNPPDFILTYHQSLESAEAVPGSADSQPLADSELTSFTITADTTIWIRLENNLTGCFTVRSFNLLVIAIPFINPDETFSLEACDAAFGLNIPTDGMAVFNLTDLDQQIIGFNTDVAVVYFESQADVDADNPITPADAYTSGNATIIAVLQSTLDAGCTNQVAVSLSVNPPPALVSDPLPDLVVCNDNGDQNGAFDLDAYTTLILDGSTSVDVFFYEDLLEAEVAFDNDNALALDTSIPYVNPTGVDTLFVVAIDTTTGCSAIYEVNLVIETLPVAVALPEDLRLCDDDDDGVAIFDLTPNAILILGFDPNDPTDPNFDPDLTVSFHESEAAAIAGTPFIATPEAFASAGQVIYARLTNMTSTCFITIDLSFELFVDPLPVIQDPIPDFEVCDDPTNDGIADFDLASIVDAITLDNVLLDVSFFQTDTTQGDNLGTAIATGIYTNDTSPGVEVIQVVVTTLQNCSIQTQVSLRVLPVPTPDNPTPAPIVVCDGDDNGATATDDGIELFVDASGTDLVAAAIASALGGQMPNIAFEVYTDVAAAEQGDGVTNIATLPFTSTIPGGQSLFIRLENDPDNSCFLIIELPLVVNPLPQINPDRIDPYTLCSDNDQTGSIDDDLATITNLLTPSEDPNNFTITYHNSEIEADNADDPLPQPLFVDEEGAGSDTIFVRVENNATGCFIVSSIVVIVEATPGAGVDPPDLVQCADDPGVNGDPDQNSATFDLTVQDGVIDPSGDPQNIVVYFTDEDLTQVIADPTAFIATGTTGGGVGENTGITQQTIYATVTNTTTQCMSEVVSFELFILELPVTVLDDDTTICVDLQSGQVLDPPTLDASPIAPVDGVIYNYYFWTLVDDGSSLSPDSNATPELLTITAAGTYQVEVVTSYEDPSQPGNTIACSYFAQTTFTAISAPEFEVEVVEESFNSSGLYTVNVINVTGADEGPYEFALDNGPFQEGVPGNPSTTFVNVTPGEHTITGRRVGAPEICGETTVDFGIIDFPRFFTPNGDGFNETWNILGLGAAPNLNASIFIFNREGKLLKQLSPQGPGWDGTVNGQLMPSNDYWFMVEFIEPATQLPREFANHFTLKR